MKKDTTVQDKGENLVRGNIIRSVRSSGVALEQNVFDMSVAFNTTLQEQEEKYAIRYFNEKTTLP
ncbi:hypothetical protein J7K99_05460 [bacterium]|nr:hypothetical protein [bacterium]